MLSKGHDYANDNSKCNFGLDHLLGIEWTPPREKAMSLASSDCWTLREGKVIKYCCSDHKCD